MKDSESTVEDRQWWSSLWDLATDDEQTVAIGRSLLRFLGSE